VREFVASPDEPAVGHESCLPAGEELAQAGTAPHAQLSRRNAATPLACQTLTPLEKATPAARNEEIAVCHDTS